MLCLGGGWAIASLDLAESGLWLWLQNLREVSHPAAFLCPFCGGTRAFVAACQFDFKSAFNHSLVGLVVFSYIVLMLPVRAVVVFWPRSREIRPLATMLSAVDSPRYQLWLVLVTWVVQKLLIGLA